MGADVRLEVHEVLACDDQAIALSITWQGMASAEIGGGEWAVSPGVVAVVEGGVAVRWEQYESDDRDAMLARYAELGGRRSVALGDRPPERWYAAYLPRHAARDIAGALELYTEDFVMVDHRALGWAEIRGRDGLRKLYESVFKASPGIRAELDEVIACDERVIVTRLSYRGQGKLAGEFEDPMGYVTVVENGQCVSMDVYGYDDDFAMLRRYHELGGRPPALGDRPPERHMGKVTQRLAAGDLAGLMDLQPAPDVVVRDRRGFPALDLRGVDAYQALVGDREARVVTRDGDLLLAGIDDDLPLFVVAKLHEDSIGEAIVLRDELRARAWLHALTLTRGYEAASVKRDTEGLLASMHPAGRIIDHRPLQFQDANDPDGIREIYDGLGELLAQPRAGIEVLDVHPGAMAEVVRWSATDRATGGAVEWQVFHAVRMRDGLIEEIHSYADPAPALEKMEELSPEASRARISRLFIEALGAHDWHALARLYAEDCVFVEHRPLTDEGFMGVGGLISMFTAMLEMVSEHAVRGELIRDGDEVFLRQINTGKWKGGPWEVVVDSIAEVHDGLLTRIELFDPGQGELRRARMAELGQAGRRGAPSPGRRRWPRT